MSQSRIHDLMLLLGAMVAVPACTERPPVDDEGGVTPEEADALDQAIELCKPYGRKVSGCYAEAYPDEPIGYVAMVGYCVASFGYASTDVAECGDAMADYFSCLTALDCDVLVGDYDDSAEPGDGEPEPYPCEAEENALEDACDWGEEVDSAPESDSG
ncbi:MAG TPA: hypothetical protein VG755_27550 [Nannocystaceae bacterium]|nr:hypothetical protein [Nannocystaceae bacterium]